VLERVWCSRWETYWPASDGYSAARVSRRNGGDTDRTSVITRFPTDELLVAGARYYTDRGCPLRHVRGARAALERGDESHNRRACHR